MVLLDLLNYLTINTEEKIDLGMVYNDIFVPESFKPFVLPWYTL